MDKGFIELLKKQLEHAEAPIHGEEMGRVTSVGDGVVQIEGLPNVMFSEMVRIEKNQAVSTEPSYAMVLNLEEYTVGAVVLGSDAAIHEGDIVKRTGKVLSVPVGEQLLGRVVNPLGQPLDGRGHLAAGNLQTLPIERPAPPVIQRESVHASLATGFKIIDALIPIGRGQRELIIGDRQTGKTALVLDTIINQLNEPEAKRPICIYVAVGQKYSKVAQLVQELKSRGAMEHTIVVAAGASDPAPLWYIAPYAGCTIGEYFRDKGKDALVIYDDLSKHAWAWRQISLLLRRPPGREAYPGDIFYLHSRLLERAAKFSSQYGGGSLTALPIVETQAGDVSAYIPTNVISITDGQIYLEADLFAKGQRPAVNIGISVSRVGSAAQTKAMKKVAGPLKLELAQYQELAAFVQFAQDLDEATRKRITRGSRLMELLKQPQFKVLPFEEQVAILFAGTGGYLDQIPLERVKEFEAKLLEQLKNQHPEILKNIHESRDLSEETRGELQKAIEAFSEDFKQSHEIETTAQK
ncbi:MAG: F0F1 ATP synthase subunit alpha [Candidatus Wildermuthbacteria bacterium]|nr:F0F1 ATP synthase subunit alpha [Candidatus Wildermuthbacteria bacterium]